MDATGTHAERPVAEMVAISSLKVEPSRAVDLATVMALAKSIPQNGGELLQPIVIDSKRRVIAGVHRVRAYQSLGRELIPARVVDLDGPQAELATLDENLVRNEGTALERSEALERRQELYEQLHPETKHGGNRRPGASGQNGHLKSFSEDTAEKTGESARSVRRQVAIAKKLSPEAKEVLRHTPAADQVTELERISRLPPKEQVKAAASVATRYPGSEDGDERFTPRELIAKLHQVHQFTVDVASHPDSPAATVVGAHWSKRDDGLRRAWKQHRVWCNPPFSELDAWVAKASAEARKGCPLIVMLLPAVRTEQGWWQEYVEPVRDGRGLVGGAQVTTRFLDGRTRFGSPADPEGKCAGSPPFGCVVVTWEQRADEAPTPGGLPECKAGCGTRVLSGGSGLCRKCAQAESRAQRKAAKAITTTCLGRGCLEVIDTSQGRYCPKHRKDGPIRWKLTKTGGATGRGVVSGARFTVERHKTLSEGWKEKGFGEWSYGWEALGGGGTPFKSLEEAQAAAEESERGRARSKQHRKRNEKRTRRSA